VTGAAGFIGSHLTKRLLDEDDFVIGVDNFDTGEKERLLPLTKGKNAHQFVFIEADMLDFGKLENIFRIHKPEVVFHLAAQGSVPRSIANPNMTIHNNVCITSHALWLSHLYPVRKFVYASSASVYGTAGLSIKIESQLLEPENPYAVSKLAAEKLVKVFSKIYNLPTTSLRFFNVFGPDQGMKSGYSAVIPSWLRAIERGEPLIVYGSGQQRRDFTYVSNVVEACMLAASASNKILGEEYNVGCDVLTSVNELTSLLSHAFSSQLVVKYEPRRMGDILESQANINKARVDLGYSPQVGVEEGIKKTVEWFKKRRVNEP